MSCHPDDITAVIPAIPPRLHTMLPRTLKSVVDQTRPVAAVSLAVDHCREGAAVTRQRALDAVNTPLVAFLDDDDQWMPHHLQRLYEHMCDTGADYVFSWYMIRDAQGIEHLGWDPMPGHFGREFDYTDIRQTTIVTLVRTELAKEVGFRGPEPGKMIDGQVAGEDYDFTVRCVEAGAKISHLAERTWWWTHHGVGAPGRPGNTSGRSDRW